MIFGSVHVPSVYQLINMITCRAVQFCTYICIHGPRAHKHVDNCRKIGRNPSEQVRCSQVEHYCRLSRENMLADFSPALDKTEIFTHLPRSTHTSVASGACVCASDESWITQRKLAIIELILIEFSSCNPIQLSTKCVCEWRKRGGRGGAINGEG